MKAKYRKGCPQRDSVEHEEYAGARSAGAWESRERDGADDQLEKILSRDNLNRAYKQVKSNHGAPGMDGMTVDAALPWLRENRDELLQGIRDGTSVVARKHFKFLGYALGKNGKGVYIRAHPQSLAKAKRKRKELTSRSQGRKARQVMEAVKVYIRGWIGHFYVADMKRILQAWNEWLRRRMRMYIWKQWKKPRTKVQNLRRLRIPEWQAYQWGNTRLGYWRIAGSAVLNRSVTKREARTGRVL